MLIVCNGAFKSGSTWLYCLLQGIFPELAPLPSEFHQDGEWNGETVPVGKLPDFLRQTDLKGRDYLLKSHYDGERERDLLLSHPDVVVFNIERDLRDVIVSAYFHYKRLKDETRGFAEYYWESGRGLIHYLKQFHQLWAAVPGKVYVSSYERLQTEFRSEVARIVRFLDLRLDDVLLASLAESVSLDKLRSWWNETDLPEDKRFFRKGIVGDWKNHFTPEIDRDFNHLDRSPTAAKLAQSNTWMQKHIDTQNTEIETLLVQHKQLGDRLSVLQGEIKQLRNSFSFRLGLTLLWPARKVRDAWRWRRASTVLESKDSIKT